MTIKEFNFEGFTFVEDYLLCQLLVVLFDELLDKGRFPDTSSTTHHNVQLLCLLHLVLLIDDFLNS